ncbi:MAG TPA: ribonuclease P protein component [Micromonosporaceae bacterium]|nr:ribonuclease P protein component [Micromonosporaceae bacterium]HCU51145.1 ribonuclease P protein component [Micromonosporaceae bacterium]
MLPAAHRLRRSNDFAAAMRGGRRVSRGSVVVHLTKPALDGDQPAKAGFVVSKAVGGAVVRNKVKRRLRHLVAERLAQLPPGSSLVVRALPGAASSRYTQLGIDLDLALEAAARPRGAK